ncbi:hypothetical protein LINPERPRIM_LOCUS4752, partial [Linum perenne]
MLLETPHAPLYLQGLWQSGEGLVEALDSGLVLARGRDLRFWLSKVP